MSETTQYDLFGEVEATEVQREHWQMVMSRSWTCTRCGQTERNGLLFRQNHGMEPGEETICGWKRGEHPVFGDMCTAQYYKRNHIIYAVQNNTDALERDMTRGRELGLDVDAIVAEAAVA